jgi:hypothetical protein
MAALALALAILLCGCGGEKGGEDNRENMDLKEMTAHLRELKVGTLSPDLQSERPDHIGLRVVIISGRCSRSS